MYLTLYALLLVAYVATLYRLAGKSGPTAPATPVLKDATA